MKKILAILFALLIFINTSYAKDKQVNNTKCIDSVISDSNIEKNSISITIKDLNSGKAVYSLNDKILMPPASVQKVLTIIPSVETLGNNYEFSTKLYKRNNETYILKLGADPYLVSKDLNNIVKHIDENTVKKIFIDDSIVEDKSWGEGWQWDDDMNTLMPRFNSYNLDKNIIKLSIIPTADNPKPTIINPSKYPLVFWNNVKTGSKNDVEIKRENSFANNSLELNGTVNKPLIVSIPTNNLKRYFYIRLNDSLANRNIYLKENFTQNTVNNSDEEIFKITHPVSNAIIDILQNSNNMTSETLAKLASEKAFNTTGTDINAIRNFNEYCKKNKLDNSRIRLADASGVSKNNLVTTEFITEFLLLNKNNEVLKQLPTPGEGTLTHRMLPLKDNLRAKTGTLSDISSIAGFITTKHNNKYAFSIIINDPSSSNYDKKTLEDYLLREVYFKL